MTFLERSDLIGSHPQSFRYYLALLAGTFRTGLDMSMLVTGTGLVGLAIAVLLDGLEIVDAGLDLGLGTALGAGLVIGVTGGFAVGVASEGRYGSVRRVDGFPSLEVALGRTIGIVVMAVLLGWAAERLGALVADLPFPFEVGVQVIDVVASTGFVVAILGVAVAWAVRQGLDRLGWGVALEVPALYLVWLFLAILTFDLPV